MIKIGQGFLKNKKKSLADRRYSSNSIGKETIVAHGRIVSKIPNTTTIIGVTNVNNLSLFGGLDSNPVKGTMYFTERGSQTFHQIIYPLLFIGQLFALFPISGIGSKFAINLRFKIMSIKVLYNCLIQTSIGFMIAITLVWICVNQIELNKTSVLVFYGSNFVASFLFMSLARKWPKLMLFWEEKDNKFPKYRTADENKRLGQYVRRLTGIFCAFALVEHLLSISSGIYKAHKCAGTVNPIERFYKLSFPQLLYFSNYTTSKLIAPLIVNMYCAFIWNFVDLFIIVVSVCLTTRLNQINYHMELAQGEAVPDSFWQINRHYYQSFIDLLAVVDKELEYIILLSFSSNLYFICLQLLNSLKIIDNMVHAIYFWYSLLFLITRTFSVALHISNIYDQSKKPIRIMYRVPNNGYTKELKRFLTFVQNETVALSGKRFFYITRQLILTIAGTIVTYELVLIQFNNNDDNLQPEDPCLYIRKKI